MLNAGGLPPLSGFIIKFKAILHLKSYFSVALVAFRGVALSFYVRLLMNAFVKAGTPTVTLMLSSVIGLV